MNKSSGRGPRRGRPDTRETIRQAARARFVAEGYQAVTMRSIAADAGVDVALVSYYFKSKQGLFGAAMALAVNPAEAFAAALEQGSVDDLATRVLRMALAVWDDSTSGPQLRAMVVAATSDPDLGRLVREAVHREIVLRLAARLGGTDRERRAGAFTTQMAGLIFSRYVLRLEPMASMTPNQIVARLSASLQLALR